ncbi:MAG: sensor histidine kinase [Chitinophagaceae bacterium]|jgi:signal transduction histidine kinase
MSFNFLNFKTVLASIAIAIVIGTIFYSNYLSNKIAAQEKQNVAIWVEAQKTLLTSNDSASINLALKISSENSSIPIIETNENDSITGNTNNIDTFLINQNKEYLQQQLQVFKSYANPIVLVLQDKPLIANKYYYGKSKLANEVAYYPLVQMFIVLLFVIVIIIALQNNYKSTQNQVWAGLAKETAHQLGTPVSSLEGWVEMLRDIKGNETIVPEMEKDVKRLLLITDRFGKIGSKPNVEQRNLVVQVGDMVEYIKKRASQKVEFKLLNTEDEVLANVSPPLFDWVIENLLKNALDAMEGKGNISVAIFNENTKAIIEVTDTGKGISKANVAKVFKAGFTTKKRGWGLGLTLTKRIVEQYHKGNIFVKYSEVGKGTCFRIEINK